ncbi:hypothetical protein V8E36_000318 [Tilletia maclaganii]
MPFAEKHVGYWLACLLLTVVFALCPFVLCFDRNLYHSTPPQGSVLGASLRLLWSASKGRWSSKPIRTYRQLTAADFWTNALPSKQVRRGFKACAVFGLYLLYWLCYNHISNNLVSQPATMTLNGVPNEIISNNDPLEILIFMPLMDLVFYPLPLATSVVYKSTVPPVAAKSTPVQPARPPLTVNHPARIYSDFREFFQLYVRRLSSGEFGVSARFPSHTPARHARYLQQADAISPMVRSKPQTSHTESRKVTIDRAFITVSCLPLAGSNDMFLLAVACCK